MVRAPVSPTDGLDPGRTLIRPASVRGRLSGRAQRLRAGWRRIAIAAGSGLTAAALAVAALSTLGGSGADRAADIVDQEAPQPPQAAPLAVDERLDDDRRVVAIDRSVVALPVSVGSIVEVVGLRPTVTEVDTEVIAASAEVVGVTDEAVLLVMDAEAAHRVGEIAHVGAISVFGRELPNP